MSALDALDARYRLILCDIWGCVHDGVNLYPGAAERLLDWRREGRIVVLITNAPRTEQAVAQQLGRIGLPRDAWDGIATSGEAGIAALKALARPVGFLGTSEDRAILESRDIEIADSGDFTDLACTGLDEQRPDAGDYADQLAGWAARDVLMHCLNPDRMVIRGGIPEACAGALAETLQNPATTAARVSRAFERARELSLERYLHASEEFFADAVAAFREHQASGAAL
jgi:HAD superfamily hydrolase (TIGR01459 family)